MDFQRNSHIANWPVYSVFFDVQKTIKVNLRNGK